MCIYHANKHLYHILTYASIPQTDREGWVRGCVPVQANRYAGDLRPQADEKDVADQAGRGIGLLYAGRR